MVAVIERLKDLYPGTGKGTGEPGGNTGLWALYKKEMGDNIHSRRFLLILALVVIAGFRGVSLPRLTCYTVFISPLP